MIKGRQKKWLEMVSSSRVAEELFNDFADDNAIVWANKELENYKRAMMVLIEGKSDNMYKGLSKEDVDLIETMERRARIQKLDLYLTKKERLK